ncbi:MAG: hypothetical protein P8Y70_01270 [Candidatus Lokiarchaeota archaeon]
MSWEEREILLVVKTYPERSKKYGNTVCTAGILEDTDEWVRIYPINFNVYNRLNLEKFIRIRAKIKKDDKDYLQRKESHKIDQDSVKVIDNSLIDPNKKGIWQERKRILKKVLAPSLEELWSKFEEDRTSLGFIRPKGNSIDFILSKPVEEIEIDIMKKIQLNLFGQKLKKVDKIEKAFSYKFNCKGAECNGHKMICEDWELLEAFRKWRKIYSTPEELEEKLRNKFLTEMITQRDLYFFVGTHWKFPKWLIIGLFYPPKEKDQKITNFFFN